MSQDGARTLDADDVGIAEAVGVLRSGGLVAFPTETVYGLGADATNVDAVARIFAAKGRPANNPLIVHVVDAEAAGRYARLDDATATLAARFWPGALTLVLPARAGNRLAPMVTAGLDTVAIRCPAAPVAQALLTGFGGAIAAPSANRSGHVSPTTATHVLAALGDAVDLILDGGPCPIGVESTIIDVSGPIPALLRPGGMPTESIEPITGPLAPAGTVIRAPGMLARHYAPRHPLRLNARSVASDEGLLAFGPTPVRGAAVTANLSERGDLAEAAHCLFVLLHRLDQARVRAIAVMPVPETGLGRAINDRLRRAATPDTPLPTERG